MRSLISFLCLAACVFHGDGLRNRATADALLEQTQLPEYRQKRKTAVKRFLWKGLMVMAEHGKKLSPMLFGTGPDSMNELLSREESLGPGCNEEDGKMAHGALDFWMDKFDHLQGDIIKQLEPLLMNMTMGPMGQPSIGDMWKIQKVVSKLSKDVMRAVPGACKDIESLFGGDISTAMTCMHKTTNVSKKCLRCIPRFFNQIGNCAEGCLNNIESMSDAIIKETEPLLQDMMEMRDSLPGMGGLVTPEDVGDAPSPKDKGHTNADVMAKMQEMEGKLLEATNKMMHSMKKVVPCLQCGKRKTDSLMGCFNLEESWKEDVDKAIDEFTGALMNESISIGEIDPMPLQAPPLVPMA